MRTDRCYCLVVTHDTGDTDYHYHETLDGVMDHARRVMAYRYVENVRIDKPFEVVHPSYDPAVTEQLPPPPAEIILEGEDWT